MSIFKRKKKEIPSLEKSPYFSNPNQYLIDKGIKDTKLTKFPNYVKN